MCVGSAKSRTEWVVFCVMISCRLLPSIPRKMGSFHRIFCEKMCLSCCEIGDDLQGESHFLDFEVYANPRAVRYVTLHQVLPLARPTKYVVVAQQIQAIFSDTATLRR